MSTGVDVGSYSIKALRLRRKGGRLQVTGVARARVFSAQEGDLDPRARAVQELTRLGRLAGLRSGVAAGITGRDLNLRFTQVPPVVPEQVRSMMEHEVIQIAGKSGGLVYTDFLGLEYPWKPLPIPMIVALAKTGFVDERMLLFAHAGIKVRDLVPNSIALFHAWRAVSPPAEETVLLLDVGAENVELVLVRDGRLVFARNVTGGGRVFTEALAGTLKLPPAKAEEVKCKEGSLVQAATEGARMALLNAAGQLQSLVQSSINFAKGQTQLADLAPDRILVSGAGARVEGLLPNLAKFLGKPVDPFLPFEAIDLSPLPESEARRVREAPTDLAIALGLALVDLEAPKVALSLLPDAEKVKRRFWREEIFLFASAAVLLLAFGLLGAGALHARAIHDGLRAQVQDEKKKQDGWANEYAELEGKRRAAQAKGLHLAAPVRDGGFVLRTLAALRAARTEGLWLVRVTADPPGESRSGGDPYPQLVVAGVIGEAAGDATRILKAFIGRVTASVPELTVKTRSIKKAADTERTEFELLLLGPGAESAAATEGKD